MLQDLHEVGGGKRLARGGYNDAGVAGGEEGGVAGGGENYPVFAGGEGVTGCRG